MDKTQVESLVAKAAQAHDSADALRFSQAACNVANALNILHLISPPSPS